MSIVHVLQKEGFAARLKWPNDILVNNKKVGGVMGDITTLSNGEMGMILSIGLNVNIQPDDARTINQPTTSLKIEEGHNFDVAKITKILICS